MEKHEDKERCFRCIWFKDCVFSESMGFEGCGSFNEDMNNENS